MYCLCLLFQVTVCFLKPNMKSLFCGKVANPIWKILSGQHSKVRWRKRCCWKRLSMVWHETLESLPGSSDCPPSSLPGPKKPLLPEHSCWHHKACFKINDKFYLRKSYFLREKSCNGNKRMQLKFSRCVEKTAKTKPEVLALQCCIGDISKDTTCLF